MPDIHVINKGMGPLPMTTFATDDGETDKCLWCGDRIWFSGEVGRLLHQHPCVAQCNTDPDGRNH
jgi:hypothetical protein